MNCLKCDKNIPIKLIIDNKERNLQRRKYCLTCSPFGKHNTRKIVIANETKHCKDCGNLLQSKRRNRCNNCNVIRYRRNLKIKLVNYKGGKCKICGYNKYIGNLAFHHVNPLTKEFSITGQSKSFERMKIEVDKCELLCHNCHGEIHAGLVKI